MPTADYLVKAHGERGAHTLKLGKGALHYIAQWNTLQHHTQWAGMQISTTLTAIQPTTANHPGQEQMACLHRFCRQEIHSWLR